MEKINIKDFLDRDEIKINDFDNIKLNLHNKVILITGAGSEIGSELAMQILKCEPKQIILFDINEDSLCELIYDLQLKKTNIDIITKIGSIRDKQRINRLLSNYSPNIVFHTDLYNHVSLMEDNPEEAIAHNILGTYNLANESGLAGVEKFVFFSADKAVNPTTVVGASKRFCEMIIQYLNSLHNTKYCSIRFCNIFKKQGTIFSLFKKQLENGGPLTITDENSARYFILLTEAVELTLECLALTNGGEIFSINLEKQTKIYELAKKMIAKFCPNKNISIENIGLKYGEKVFEEIADEVKLVKTSNDKIMFEKAKKYNFGLIKKMRRLEFDTNVLSRQNLKQNIFDAIKE